MKIDIEYEKQVTFVCQEGCYKGTLDAIKPFREDKDGKTYEFMKFIFVLNVPSIPDKTVKVIKKVLVAPISNTQLRKFLEGWLGAEEVKKLNGADMEVLIGKEAAVHVHQEFNKGFDDPLTVVDAVLPVSSIDGKQIFKYGGEEI